LLAVALQALFCLNDLLDLNKATTGTSKANVIRPFGRGDNCPWSAAYVRPALLICGIYFGQLSSLAISLFVLGFLSLQSGFTSFVLKRII